MPLVNNKEARQINLAGIVLLAPGINQVPDEVWKEAAKHSSTTLLLDSKLIEVVRRADDGASINTATVAAVGVSAPAPEDINDLEPPDAIRIVGLTFDRALLALWAGSAKNKDVKGAIEQQLKAAGFSQEEIDGISKTRRAK